MRTTIKYNHLDEDKRINNPQSAMEYIGNVFRRKDREEVWVLYADNANHPLMKKLSTVGTLTQCLIDNRRIIKDALNCNAAQILIAHNHPSNDVNPSAADITQTEELNKACKLFGLSLMDHLIVGEKSFYSFHQNEKFRIGS